MCFYYYHNIISRLNRNYYLLGLKVCTVRLLHKVLAYKPCLKHIEHSVFTGHEISPPERNKQFFFSLFHNRISSFFKNSYGDKNYGYTNYSRLNVSLFYAAIVETFIENEDFYLFCYFCGQYKSQILQKIKFMYSK